MSDQMVRMILGSILLLHGLGHGGAMVALAWIARFGPGHSGDWHAARAWLVPDLAPSTATAVASVVWAVALVGFVAAALSFWGVVSGEAWRPLAVVSAIVSMLGILAFFGVWPTFNTVAALGVNVAVLVALLWLQWPPQAMFGK